MNERSSFNLLLSSLDSRNREQQLLAERGGRIARGLFYLRSKVGLVTADESLREELIAHHQRLRQDPKGVIWNDDEYDRLLK